MKLGYLGEQLSSSSTITNLLSLINYQSFGRAIIQLDFTLYYGRFHPNIPRHINNNSDFPVQSTQKVTQLPTAITRKGFFSIYLIGMLGVPNGDSLSAQEKHSEREKNLAVLFYSTLMSIFRSKRPSSRH